MFQIRNKLLIIWEEKRNLKFQQFLNFLFLPNAFNAARRGAVCSENNKSNKTDKPILKTKHKIKIK